MDILNYQKILYINSIVRNKWFVHLVVSRMTGRCRERTEWRAAKRECGFNIQRCQPVDPFGCINHCTMEERRGKTE
ncbi:hypothetical protein I656_03339 [Geobacillus sp. WSUCF1]|nr:hypothetical protein I656_03339 [Geobacillus sp. WSUCF1]